DTGLNNLVTLVSNTGARPVVINGRKIKSLNQWYNKRLAELRSIYDRTGVKKGRKMTILLTKRDKKINDWFHKISHWIVEWCKENDIDTLVVGRNKNWKQKINLGKKTNQSFVTIPFYKLIHQLQYKCEDAGIRYLETGESYTSKCSFLDLEPLQKQKAYKGRRVKRGLFRSAKGYLINADVNGGYNIIRKVNPSAFNHWLTAEGLAGAGLHPKRERVY
ncbi:MAG: RNA-guided endonuclease TnpB family protein, partial [Candidatus Hodarchaeales archaeon]